MEIVVTKDYEGDKYFANLFNSNNVLMTRIPVTEEFCKLDPVDQYKELKENYPDIIKRIR